MMKVAVVLFLCGLAFAEEKRQDTAILCANIKNALDAINRGAQQVGGGTNVEEVKKTVDGPAEASKVNGNVTLLIIAYNKNRLDSAAKKCLDETAKQAAAVADYIDTIKAQLQNDKDKVLDVQRNLRSAAQLVKELESPQALVRINREKDQICRDINAKFDKIDSGAKRIVSGEDVKKVKADVDGPQLASDISANYSRLLIADKSNLVKDKALEECLKNVSARAQQQVAEIQKILPQLSQDEDKVKAVFKSFRLINELQRLEQSPDQKNACVPDTAQLCANIKNALEAINKGAQQVSGGTNVEEVKKTVDGPAQASIINGNITLLIIATIKNPLDFAARKCLEETAKQSAAVADYIDTIKPQLQNDKDKVLDVQRKLRSSAQLQKEFESPLTLIRINQERAEICKNINAIFDKINSGATRIANGEDVKKVKADVDGPALANKINEDYNRLLIASPRDECLATTSARAAAQVKQIEGILPKLTEDKDKVQAVFNSYWEINLLESQRIRCLSSPGLIEKAINGIKNFLKF